MLFIRNERRVRHVEIEMKGDVTLAVLHNQREQGTFCCYLSCCFDAEFNGTRLVEVIPVWLFKDRTSSMRPNCSTDH